MPTITPDQLAYIRDVTGDDCAPPVISDVTIQKDFDTTAGDVDKTIVYTLRRLVGKYAKKIDSTSGEGMDNANAQLYEHTRELLEDWLVIAGMDGGRLGDAVLDLNIDWDEADVESLD